MRNPVYASELYNSSHKLSSGTLLLIPNERAYILDCKLRRIVAEGSPSACSTRVAAWNQIAPDRYCCLGGDEAAWFLDDWRQFCTHNTPFRVIDS